MRFITPSIKQCFLLYCCSRSQRIKTQDEKILNRTGIFFSVSGHFRFHRWSLKGWKHRIDFCDMEIPSVGVRAAKVKPRPVKRTLIINIESVNCCIINEQVFLSNVYKKEIENISFSYLFFICFSCYLWKFRYFSNNIKICHQFCIFSFCDRNLFISSPGKLIITVKYMRQ